MINKWKKKNESVYLKKMNYSLTIVLFVFARVGTIEKFSVKQLNADNSENELKQKVNDQNIDDIFQRSNHTIEHSFQFRDSFDSF